MAGLEALDPIYFARKPWPERFKRWLRQHAPKEGFAAANASAVEVISRRPDLGLRLAVNIPPHALLLFLRDGAYKNAYERHAELGETPPPSATRATVDAALFRAPDKPEEFYFAAVVLGGTGVRYYGEYCLVLKENAVPDNTLVLDRNSYDMVFEPLVGRAPIQQIADTLRGRWSDDVLAMVKMKVVPALGATPRLTTAGAASEALLHDESFIEVHKRGPFGPDELHELRTAAADATVGADLLGRSERGYALSQEEATWLRRRHEVDRALSTHGLRVRIIVTTGRTPR